MQTYILILTLLTIGIAVVSFAIIGQVSLQNFSHKLRLNHRFHLRVQELLTIQRNLDTLWNQDAKQIVLEMIAETLNETEKHYDAICMMEVFGKDRAAEIFQLLDTDHQKTVRFLLNTPIDANHKLKTMISLGNRMISALSPTPTEDEMSEPHLQLPPAETTQKFRFDLFLQLDGDVYRKLVDQLNDRDLAGILYTLDEEIKAGFQSRLPKTRVKHLESEMLRYIPLSNAHLKTLKKELREKVSNLFNHLQGSDHPTPIDDHAV